MKAVVFHNDRKRHALSYLLGLVSRRAFVSPIAATRLRQVPAPVHRGEDWALLDGRLCGICGSDTKQILLDGRRDNPLTAIISFPHVLGHEYVGTVREPGSAVPLSRSDRVALVCSIGCEVRGIVPRCRWCASGYPPLCENLTGGGFGPAIHIGNSRDLNGGFSEQLVAHRSQLMKVPDHVSDEQAVFSDTVSVGIQPLALHPPLLDRPVLVYGAGSIGLCLVGALRAMYPSCEMWVVARHPHQQRAAMALGATAVFGSKPAPLIEAIARRAGSSVRQPWYGLPWLEGGVGTVYDTITSAETIEVSLRVADKRARIVHLGVSTPKRFEWTLLYFKELQVIGSNAFGAVTWQGQRMHCYQLYYELCRQGLDLSPLLTHRFGLDQWATAVMHAVHRKRYESIKVGLSPVWPKGGRIVRSEPREQAASSPTAQAA